jgi:hypothetical protein
MHCRTFNPNHRWVAHITEAARQTAPREADPPQNLAGRKSGLSALPYAADVCLPCGSPSGLPTNCGTPFSTLPESLTSLTVHLRAHLPILHTHGNKRIMMGTWWEQEEFDGNFLGTWWEQKNIDGNNWNLMGIFWELDENKRILMSYWREQEEFDGNLMGTKGFWWVIVGNERNLIGIFLETVWELDGKSNPHPFKKIRNSPWGHVWATQLAHPFEK